MKHWRLTLVLALFCSAPILKLNSADGMDHAEMDEFAAQVAKMLPAKVVAMEPYRARVVSAADRARLGTWGPVIQWPHIPVTASNLPNGKIMTFSSNQRTSFPRGPEQTFTAVYDPGTGKFVEVMNSHHDMFCGHPAMLPDGRPLIAGGRNQVKTTSVFDYKNNRWLKSNDMNDGRWYPTSTLMPDGSVIIASGNRGTGVDKLERWYPGVGWRRLNNINWNGMTRDFPANFVAPNGRLINTNVKPLHNYSSQGGGIVMYDVGKILLAGGNTNLCHTIDINSNTPVTRRVASMKFKRRFQNGLVLPDGNVIVVGGNTSGIAFSDQGSIMAAEMWNPKTNKWTELADMSVPRNYHSVALLLPDGRVFSGGGGLSGNSAVNHQDGQLYSPPYLYTSTGAAAKRPTITTLPSVAKPGRKLAVKASAGVRRFTMVRMTSTTHSFSSDVRFLEVPFANKGNGNYEITLHSNINVLVPGYWMVYALDVNGVPSVAKILKVAIPSVPKVTSPGNQVTLSGTPVSFSISASDFDGDPLTFTATGLPAGLKISSKGAITGVPKTLGTKQVTVFASDGQSRGSVKFNWTITGQSGLSAHFPFDEGTGTKTANAVNGKLVGNFSGKPTWQNGFRGKAITFSGGADRVVVNHEAAIDVGRNNANFTVSFWMYLREGKTGKWRNVMHKGAANSQRTFAMWMNPGNNQLHYGVSTTANSNEVRNSVAQLSVNRWTHIAMTKVGNKVNLYLNGKLDSSRTLSAAVLANTGALHIGSDPWYPGTKSTMEDLAIYKRGLTSSEITYLANNKNHVIGANFAPKVTNPGNKTNKVGDSVRLTLNASDINGDKMTFSATGLPTGLTINQTSGVIQGKPTRAGAFAPTVKVSDGKLTTSIKFQWAIRAKLNFTAPTTTPNQFGGVSSFTIKGTGQNLTYTWNFGDGTKVVTTQNGTVKHTFTKAGIYVVKVTIKDDVGQTQEVSFRQVVHDKLTAKKPAVSQTLSYETRNKANDRVWVANPDNNTVSVFDAVSNKKLGEIAVGEKPRSVAIADNGAIWVTNKTSATISVIDQNTLKVSATIRLAQASEPHGVAANPAGAGMFVALEGTGRVQRFDDVSRKATGSVAVGADPRHVSINAAGSLVYVSRFITPLMPGEATAKPVIPNNKGGEVVIVGVSDLKVKKRVILRNSTRPDSGTASRGIPNYLGPLAISPDGKTGWVASKQDNIQRGALRDKQPLSHDRAVRSIASKVNLGTGAEIHAARVDFDNASPGVTSLFGRYGNYLFTALEGSRQVSFVDTVRGVEVSRFDTGFAPQGLALSNDGKKLYVHNFLSRNVTVHDLSTLVQGGNGAPKKIATWKLVNRELMAANVLKGKRLFYDTADVRLASEEYISCAACHNDGGHDGRVWDLGQFGEGLRNTIDLRGKAGMAHGRLHWTGNFDEVQDFEGQIRSLAKGGGLLSQAHFNATKNPLGARKAGRSADLDAMAAYVASLKTVGKSPTKSGNQLTAAAKNGRNIFAQLKCMTCHKGKHFTDSTASGKLHSIGTIKPTSGKRLNGTLTGIDTPTLKGLWKTGPYLHDGSAVTLEAAIQAHKDIKVSAAQLAALKTYLLQLDDIEAAPDAPIPPTSTSLLTNHGFEKGLSGWGSWNPVSLSSKAFAGSQAAQLSNSLLTQGRSAVGGSSYQMIGQYMTEQAPGWLEASISFYDARGNEVGFKSEVLSVSAKYKRFTINAKAPASAKTLFVAFWCGSGGRLLLDDIQLKRDTTNEQAGPAVSLSTGSNKVNGPFSIEATFNEGVTGLTASDFVVSNGKIGGLSSLSAANYFATINPTAAGTVRVKLPAKAAKNQKGIDSQASNELVVGYQVVVDPPKPEAIGLTLTSGTAKRVTFKETFTKPVVLTSIQRTSKQPPMVVRLAKLAGGSVEVKVERLDKSAQAVGNVKVDLYILEEGTYSSARDGIKMEVGTVKLTETSGSWTDFSKGSQVSLVQRYKNPVVVGQIQTSNSAKWSQFWSRGKNVASPVSATDVTMTIGHHIGEDPDTWREADEIAGYVVIEAGNGKFQGLNFLAGNVVSKANANTSVPLTQPVGDNYQGFFSQSGMKDDNGTIPAYVSKTAKAIVLKVQEDQLNDTEESHPAENFGYFLIGK